MPIRIFLFYLLFLGTFFLLPRLTGFFVDFLWFQEIELFTIFKNILLTKLLLAMVGFLGFYLPLQWLFLFFLKKIEEQPPPHPFDPFTSKISPFFEIVRRHGPGLILLSAFLAALTFASKWNDFLLFRHGSTFGENDPVFGKDLGFYFFHLPWIQFCSHAAWWLLVLASASAAVLVLLSGAIRFQAPKTPGEPWFFQAPSFLQRPFFLFVFAFFMISTLQTAFVSIPRLLYSQTGPLVGASFTDLHATLPLKRLVVVLGALCALLALGCAFLRRKALRSAMTFTAGFYFFFVLVVESLYPSLIQKFIVAPNEFIKETPSLERHIQATRRAFQLQNIEERDLPATAPLTRADVRKNAPLLRNIRLWEREPLLDTFSQLQEIRTYYEFHSVDNDRYRLDGELRQVLLSARELQPKSLPHRNFINERLTFTHGYGLALCPVNEVTPEGLPVLWVKDLPPVATHPRFNVTEPSIFYGELPSHWVIVSTRAQEFHYPSGEENIFTHYEGKGGVPLSSLSRKILFSIHLKSLKILLSNDLTYRSRIMIYRNIQERAKKAFPFLELDQDPYLVITREGRLKWIQDAYTTSRFYPYAAFVELRSASLFPKKWNYIRNSIKIVIDAYDGGMTAYAADPSDPLLLTYQSAFPGVFRSLGDMPDDLRAHLRYPQDLFSIQARLFAVYHMENVQVFYNKEDQWDIPTFGKDRTELMMRHIIMRLPEEAQEEYILMLPYTPRGKDNLAAWMVARNDGLHYGQLIVYRFPKQSLVFGPVQVMNRINQDAEISRQISLWDQRGSQVIRGSLLILPIEKALLYIQPLYLKAEGGRIPELKRVIAAYENRIAMEETLEDAVFRLFEDASSTPSSSRRESAAPSLDRARSLLQAALKALQKGDFAAFGEHLKKLEQILGSDHVER